MDNEQTGAVWGLIVTAEAEVTKAEDIKEED